MSWIVFSRSVEFGLHVLTCSGFSKWKSLFQSFSISGCQREKRNCKPSVNAGRDEGDDGKSKNWTWNGEFMKQSLDHQCIICLISFSHWFHFCSDENRTGFDFPKAKRGWGCQRSQGVFVIFTDRMSAISTSLTTAFFSVILWGWSKETLKDGFGNRVGRYLTKFVLRCLTFLRNMNSKGVSTWKFEMRNVFQLKAVNMTSELWPGKWHSFSIFKFFCYRSISIL